MIEGQESSGGDNKYHFELPFRIKIRTLRSGAGGEGVLGGGVTGRDTTPAALF